MKWTMAFAAVLAVPALAFGAASFTLTSSGSAGITIDNGGSFTVDIGITHDLYAVSGFDMGLIASANDVFVQTARTYNLGSLDKNVPSDGVYLNATNAKVYTSALAHQNMGGIHTATYWFGNPLNIVSIDMTGTGPGTYALTLGSPGAAGLNILDEAYSFVSGVTAGTLEVTITPEPASMLLLIGALPFLRRRRSA